MAGSSYLTRATEKKPTPQSEKLPGSNQEKNSGGGFSFLTTDMERLRRFLILGSEGGSFYVGEKELTIDNLAAVNRCIVQDGIETVRQIVSISEAGRAPKNDPALFALAMCAAYGDDDTRRFALISLPNVARTGTHLLHFASFVNSMRGWGRGLRAAIADWYTLMEPGKLAFQIVKYQSRDGWSHSDLLSKTHPQPAANDATMAEILTYIKKGWPDVGKQPHGNRDLQIIWAHERAKSASEAELIELIQQYRIPMESIPTDKRTPAVYQALIPGGGITWLIRNLGNLSKHGVIGTGKWTQVDAVCERLTNEANIRAGRVHPMSILMALTTYKSGKSQKGESTWPVVAKVCDALESAFYKAFGNVQPTGSRFVLALDVSKSMDQNGVNGSILTAREASAAMALVTSKVEERVVTIGFTAGDRKGDTGQAFTSGRKHGNFPYNAVSELPLGRYDRLVDSVGYLRTLDFGGTDCALPMQWAMANGVEADAFVIYTDNETWAGNIHPSVALQQYRDKTGIPARLIVVGMTATQFSIADPNDAGMLDVVGFDTEAPAVISEFAAGRV